MKQNSNTLVIISGSIAAYKSPEIIRFLQKHGHKVKAIMTESSASFITPLTIQTITSQDESPYLDTGDSSYLMRHIMLAKWADNIVIAPATASTIAKIATGAAGCDLSATILASTANIFVAPSMNKNMWQNEALQNNINILTSRNVTIINPTNGSQACGDYGYGCMASPQDIARAVLTKHNSPYFFNKNVTITLGATIEEIDPVRYISNYSSGFMGNSIAHELFKMGANVTAIKGSSSVTEIPGVNYINVKSADDMYNAVISNVSSSDIFIATAAVSDYKVAKRSINKIKKSGTSIMLELVENPDILKTVANKYPKLLTVGFSAETDICDEKLRLKMMNKGCDILIANKVGVTDCGFNSEFNEVSIYNEKNHKITHIGRAHKHIVAKKICSFIESFNAVNVV